MRVAVLVNPSAGGGRAAAVCAGLMPALAGHEAATVRGFGAELLPGVRALEAPQAAGYVARVQQAVRALCAGAPELLLLVGGDGFAAYAADALLGAGCPVPRLVGVAGGTANVGPIIALAEPPASLEGLSYQPVGALEVCDEDGHIAYAFNDVVLGDTYLTTVDGRTVTASAEALWRDGRTQPCAPMADIGPVAVEINGRRARTRLPRVAQAVASTLERDRFYGRAVTGLLCFAPDSPYRAALLLSERAIVSLADDPLGFERPALMEQLLFTGADTVTLAGFEDGVSAVIDGNPYRRRGRVRLRYHERLLLAAEREGETTWKC